MHKHITTISQSPTQKFHEKLKNPKNFEKPPKPRSKMHECMKREKMGKLTKCLELEKREFSIEREVRK